MDLTDALQQIAERMAADVARHPRWGVLAVRATLSSDGWHGESEARLTPFDLISAGPVETWLRDTALEAWLRRPDVLGKAVGVTVLRKGTWSAWVAPAGALSECRGGRTAFDLTCRLPEPWAAPTEPLPGDEEAVRRAWQTASARYEAHPGADSAALRELAEGIPVPLPADLETLLRLTDGATPRSAHSPGPGRTEPPYLLSARTVRSSTSPLYRRSRSAPWDHQHTIPDDGQVRDVLDSPGWLSFAHDEDNDYVIDLAPGPAGHAGQILAVGDHPTLLVAASLPDWLAGRIVAHGVPEGWNPVLRMDDRATWGLGPQTQHLRVEGPGDFAVAGLPPLPHLRTVELVDVDADLTGIEKLPLVELRLVSSRADLLPLKGHPALRCLAIHTQQRPDVGLPRHLDVLPTLPQLECLELPPDALHAARIADLTQVRRFIVPGDEAHAEKVLGRHFDVGSNHRYEGEVAIPTGLPVTEEPEGPDPQAAFALLASEVSKTFADDRVAVVRIGGNCIDGGVASCHFETDGPDDQPTPVTVAEKSGLDAVRSAIGLSRRPYAAFGFKLTRDGEWEAQLIPEQPKETSLAIGTRGCYAGFTPAQVATDDAATVEAIWRADEDHDDRPGADDEEFAEAEERLGFPIPEILKTLLRVRNGGEALLSDDDDPDSPGGFATCEVFSAEYVATWHGYTQRGDDADYAPVFAEPGMVQPVHWHPGWLPFAARGDGDFVRAIDLAPGPKGRAGQVIIMPGEDFDGPVLEANSLAEWLQGHELPRPAEVFDRVLLASADPRNVAPDIQELALIGPGSVCLRDVAHLRRLTCLYLTNAEVDLTGVEALPLLLLNISGGSMDLAPLRNHPTLRSLTIGSAYGGASSAPRVDDLEAVTQLPTLERLAAPGAVLDDVRLQDLPPGCIVTRLDERRVAQPSPTEGETVLRGRVGD